MPAGAVLVDRSTKWGNPILLTDLGAQYPSVPTEGLARMAVRDFEVLAKNGRLSFPNWRFAGGNRGPVDWTYPSVDEIRAELAGHDLACWCPLETEAGGRYPCHADVLIAIANTRPTDQKIGQTE